MLFCPRLFSSTVPRTCLVPVLLARVTGHWWRLWAAPRYWAFLQFSTPAAKLPSPICHCSCPRCRAVHDLFYPRSLICPSHPASSSTVYLHLAPELLSPSYLLQPAVAELPPPNCHLRVASSSRQNVLLLLHCLHAPGGHRLRLTSPSSVTGSSPRTTRPSNASTPSGRGTPSSCHPHLPPMPPTSSDPRWAQPGLVLPSVWWNADAPYCSCLCTFVILHAGILQLHLTAATTPTARFLRYLYGWRQTRPIRVQNWIISVKVSTLFQTLFGFSVNNRMFWYFKVLRMQIYVSCSYKRPSIGSYIEKSEIIECMLI
jgi:hypothetical protein